MMAESRGQGSPDPRITSLPKKRTDRVFASLVGDASVHGDAQCQAAADKLMVLRTGPTRRQHGRAARSGPGFGAGAGDGGVKREGLAWARSGGRLYAARAPRCELC
jgi:hypothetical protein